MTQNNDKKDYKSTLNITLNDKDPGAFPQRGALPTREPLLQQRWDEANLYRKSVDKDAPRGQFILHDGPPYSNGDIHLGHALNKVAKDVVTRFKTMQGYRAPYVPGWDNHGMPIENAVSRKFREKKQAVDRVTLRQACRVYAAEWVETQRKQFKRLGIRGDWQNPYLTMSKDFEADIVSVFGEMAEQGFVYRGLKPVMWCSTCETALADAEVEYEDHKSNSIYVRFPLVTDAAGVFALPDSGTDADLPAYAIIWTTTPWTIPANLAIAAHPQADYSVVRATTATGAAHYLVAEALVEAAMLSVKAETYEKVKSVKAEALEGLVFKHPLFERESPLLFADYVTMDTGTGLVHTAPGHGKEDFETGIRYGLEVLNPVDGSGRYTAEAGSWNGTAFQGLRVISPAGDERDSAANTALIAALTQSGNLLDATRYSHSYPHCWRCHSPLIFRATVQWFMNIDHDGFREKALNAISEVAWIPKESINRITNMVAGRPDWCVSRQRAWGVGIPAFYCDSCSEPILTKSSTDSVVALVRREGSDAWYFRTPEEILPAGFQCPHCAASVDKLRKETDVLDVWFDSGSTNRAVLENHATWPDLSWPADMYLEGGDQHRGWFNSSLMIGVATKGSAPYRSVITSGWTLDEHGEAFSKSKGNGVNPLTVIDKYGADIVRWWVASQNFMEDTKCGDNLLAQVAEMYRRIRNTFRFLINNLYDFQPDTDAVAVEDMEELDRWALAQLDRVVQGSVSAYERYEFHRVYQSVLNFCSVELSSFYLDVLKDRLYASAPKSRERLSAQTAMHRIAETLARLLAPILVHTADEVWGYLRIADKPESVHLAELPAGTQPDLAIITRWEPVLVARDIVKKALEEARQAGQIGNPLESRVDLFADAETLEQLSPFAAQLPSLLLVSQAGLNLGDEPGLKAVCRPADGVKCARCWLVKTDIGSDAGQPDLCTRCASAVAGRN